MGCARWHHPSAPRTPRREGRMSPSRRSLPCRKRDRQSTRRCPRRPRGAPRASTPRRVGAHRLPPARLGRWHRDRRGAPAVTPRGGLGSGAGGEGDAKAGAGVGGRRGSAPEGGFGDLRGTRVKNTQQRGV